MCGIFYHLLAVEANSLAAQDYLCLTDETGSGLPFTIFILMAIALCGQLFEHCVAGKLSQGATKTAKCNQDIGLCSFVVIAILPAAASTHSRNFDVNRCC